MEYEPLESARYEIRLLTIQPLEPSDNPRSAPIRCTVEHFSLHEDFLLDSARDASSSSATAAINFDEFVTGKPQELFKATAEERRRDDPERGEGTNPLRRLADRLGRRLGRKRDSQKGTTSILNPDISNDGFGLLLAVENEKRKQAWQLAVESQASTTAPPCENPSPHAPTARFRPRFKWGDYVAMSYCWGDPASTREIFLNGHSHQATENLEAGLRQFRNMEYFQNGGKIWIDALCINQKDLVERGEQVQMMGMIYREAGNVIVWLGEGTEGSSAAIDDLQQQSRFYRTEYVEALDNHDASTAQSHREVAHMQLQNSLQGWTLPEDPAILGDLYDFFNRPYWRRLWIIQELAYGRAGMPIVCGSRVTQWRYIRDAAFLYADRIGLLREATALALAGKQKKVDEEHTVNHVARIAQLESHGHRKRLPTLPGRAVLPVWSTPGPGHGPLQGSVIKQALFLLSQARATDPRDRVYGMLALPGLPRLDVKVDYEKRPRDVFTEFVRALVDRGSLEFFSLLDGAGNVAFDEQDQRLPCWVPNFGASPHCQIGQIEGKWYASGFEQGFLANESHLTLPEIIDDEVLICYGFEVDYIDGIGAIPSLDRQHMRFHPTFRPHVCQPLQKTENWPYPNDTVERIIGHTLVTGTRMSGAKIGAECELILEAFTDDKPPENSLDSRIWDFMQSCGSLWFNNQELKSYSKPYNPDRAATREVRQVMEARTRGRRLTVTGSGLLGLVPYSTQPLDVILILVGHEKPVVARRWLLDNGNYRYHLIGEAFISGMMQGEKVMGGNGVGSTIVRPCHFLSPNLKDRGLMWI